jgi:arginyl-tRNA synthetase
MATVSFLGLQAFVAEIGLGPIPSFAAADVLNNPIDIYRSYLAEVFRTLVECDPDLVYNSIQPASTVGNGDLDFVLPKLKLSSASPKELAGELLKKVSSIHILQGLLRLLGANTSLALVSFSLILSLPFPSKMAVTFASFSHLNLFHISCYLISVI